MSGSTSIVGIFVTSVAILIVSMLAFGFMQERRYNDDTILSLYSNSYSIKRAFTFHDIQRMMYTPLCDKDNSSPSDLCYTVATHKDMVLKDTMKCREEFITADNHVCKCVAGLIDKKWESDGKKTQYHDKILNNAAREEMDTKTRECIASTYVHRVAVRDSVRIPALYLLLAAFVCAATAQLAYAPTPTTGAEGGRYAAVSRLIFRPYSVLAFHAAFLILSILLVLNNENDGAYYDYLVPLGHVLYLAFVAYMLRFSMVRLRQVLPAEPTPTDGADGNPSAKTNSLVDQWRLAYFIGGTMFALPFFVAWYFLFTGRGDYMLFIGATASILLVSLCTFVHCLANIQTSAAGESNADDDLFGEEVLFLVSAFLGLNVLANSFQPTLLSQIYNEMPLALVAAVLVVAVYIGPFMGRWTTHVTSIFLGLAAFVGLGLQLRMLAAQPTKG